MHLRLNKPKSESCKQLLFMKTHGEFSPGKNVDFPVGLLLYLYEIRYKIVILMTPVSRKGN